MLAGVYDLGRDWQTRPFIDLQVTDDNVCPAGYESTYERVFYGLDVGCDCLGITHRNMEGDNRYNVGAGCTSNQTRYGCRAA